MNEVVVLNLHDAIVDQLIEFDIDTRKAGIGELKIIVQNGRIPCNTIP